MQIAIQTQTKKCHIRHHGAFILFRPLESAYIVKAFSKLYVYIFILCFGNVLKRMC
jgi:hypothetical protein